MLDTTSYSDKLPFGLNVALKELTGGECIMVRLAAPKDRVVTREHDCHENVRLAIEKFGGGFVSGWLLARLPKEIENGLYIWSFHSVWRKPDGKLLDVTKDRNYKGRDKTIFVPDSLRVPDMIENISYNNFVVFTERSYAASYSRRIGVEIHTNTPYWADDQLSRLLKIQEHSGKYRQILSNDCPNLRHMCDEYEVDVIRGQLVPRPGSKYSDGNIPSSIFFDYSLRSS